MVVPVREDLLYGLTLTARRLKQGVVGQVAERRQKLVYLQRLLPDPRRQVVQSGLRLHELEERLRRVAPLRVRTLQERVATLARVLVAHSPTAPLERGYVYLTRDGVPVRSAQADAGEILVHFNDGQRKAVLQ